MRVCLSPAWHKRGASHCDTGRSSQSFCQFSPRGPLGWRLYETAWASSLGFRSRPRAVESPRARVGTRRLVKRYNLVGEAERNVDVPQLPTTRGTFAFQSGRELAYRQGVAIRGRGGRIAAYVCTRLGLVCW